MRIKRINNSAKEEKRMVNEMALSHREIIHKREGKGGSRTWRHLGDDDHVMMPT